MINEYKDNINLYLKKYNLLFYNIPKVASSTIWSICAQLEKEYHVNHSKQIRSIKLSSIKSSDLGHHQNVKKIAFVRNPYDRLVSTYRNKIEKKHIKFLKRNKLSSDLTFEGFVQHVCQLDDSDSDRHFRSQYTFVFNHQAQLIADDIGRFENFNSDFEAISMKHGLPKVAISHWNKEQKKHYSAYYTDDLRAQVSQRYAIDLMLFGYDYNKPLEEAKKKDWAKPLSLDMQLAIIKYKSQKLLRVVKHKEKYDDLPKGLKGLFVRKYRQYFTNYFD